MDEPLQLPAGPGISDENVATSIPYVRALVVQRLEQMWRTVDPHIQTQVNPDTGLVMRPDPRFLEAGIRILDRLSDLFRLKGTTHQNSQPPEADRDARILEATRRLAELEHKSRDVA